MSLRIKAHLYRWLTSYVYPCDRKEVTRAILDTLRKRPDLVKDPEVTWADIAALGGVQVTESLLPL